MKKIYFSFILLFAGLTLSRAQSLTQANNAPALGDSYRTTDVSTVGVTPGPAGSSVTWNMASVSIGTNITAYSVVAVPSSSQAAYPSASVAVQTGTSSVYNFYTPSSSDLKYWGGSITVSTVNVNMTYTSAAVYETYTMSYNSTNTNPIGGSIFVPAFSLSGSFTGTCTISADGTGTLSLPSRNFNNVLRKKTRQDISFTTSFGGGTITQENYEYFAPGLTKSPLFTISTSTFVSALGNSSQTVVTVNSDYQTVGINEYASNNVNFDLFPNPVRSNFNIAYSNENAEASSYEIINAIGQTIKKSDLGNEKGVNAHNVNVDELPSGVYFVRVHVGSKTSVKKLTIQ